MFNVTLGRTVNVGRRFELIVVVIKLSVDFPVEELSVDFTVEAFWVGIFVCELLSIGKPKTSVTRLVDENTVVVGGVGSYLFYQLLLLAFATLLYISVFEGDRQKVFYDC